MKPAASPLFSPEFPLAFPLHVAGAEEGSPRFTALPCPKREKPLNRAARRKKENKFEGRDPFCP